MRKTQKREILECIDSLHQAHEEIKAVLYRNEYDLTGNMIGECQEFAAVLGESIEKTEGEGHIAVASVEDYCELLFHVYEQIVQAQADEARMNDGNVGERQTCFGQTNASRIHKVLRRKLLAVENRIKNDITVRKEVVFFPYKASMWDSLESVYLAAAEDPDCDAYCVPIPYFDLNQDHSFGQMHYEGGEYPENIEIMNWQEYDFETRRPDVIYIHNPYDGCNLVTSVHPRYYSSNLKKYTDTLVYIPYYVTSGGMMEAQSMLPAYLYVDYIVIQAPEFRAYFDQNLPDCKFLPLGSPKFDRVANQCMNPPEPPAEWQRKMTGRDGRRRRVFFYNTSISGMLADTEHFLKKMKYVFTRFEGREDVCLLWRPHPLLETSFDSMRPQYRREYDALKAFFIEKELGILDITPDIASSVALSDAYIGDAGTSVTSLFGVAGKPIFILNNKILESPGEDGWREVAAFRFWFQEQDRFAIIQGNKLYISAAGQYDYHYCCNLTDQCHRRDYSVVLEIGGKKYACPGNMQDILVIGDKGIEKKIELKKEQVSGRTFSGAWKYERFLLLLPLRYPALVRCDTKTGQCTCFEECMDVFIKDKDGQTLRGGAYIHQGILYLSSPTDNMIWILDIENGKTQVVELPIQSRCGCNELVEYQGVLWLLPYTGKVIVRWNPQTGEVREYAGFPHDFICIDHASGQMCEELPFGTMAFSGEYLYFAPQQGNMYLRLHIHTGLFEQWKPPFEEKEIRESGAETTKRSGVFLHWKPEENSGWIKIYSNAERRLYAVNMKTGESSEIEIKFDRKELEAHEPGFGECSETLPYACIENALNPLDRFLNGVTAGNPFDKQRQLAAYRETAANSDGSCGRKIYEYIKAQD